MILNTKGIIIREYVVGESDKFITLFTKEMGKIQVSAPRAKKYDRGLASGTQLFVYGEFTLGSYKDTYKLLGVEIIKMFHSIREDLLCLSYATYIAEFLAEVTYEGMAQSELMHLTLITLNTLSKKPETMHLIRRVFEFKAMALLGFLPELNHCMNCHKEIGHEATGEYFFDIEEGGLVCKKCVSNKTYIPLDYTLLYTLHYILYTPIKAIFNFTLDEKTLKRLEMLCDRYVAYYIDKKFKTIEFIRSIESM